MTSGIEKAIKAAGSETNLAIMLGVSQQAVSKWRKRGYVPLRPVDRATQIANNIKIDRRELLDPELLASIEGV